jgi:hypothetical protein
MTRIGVLVVSALLASGCDEAKKAAEDALGGEDAGPVDVQLPVEDDAPVSALTDAQKAEMCGAVAEAVRRAVPATDKCDVAGLLGAASAANRGIEAVRTRCGDIVDPCRAAAAVGGAAEDEIPEIPTGDCALFAGDTSACATTAATLRTCLNDVAQVAVDSLRAVSCETLTLEGLADTGRIAVGDEAPSTEACVQVQQECPGVFTAGGAADAGAADAGAADAGG